jgi:hypothetical protein
MDNLLVLCYLAPFGILMVALFLVGIINMGCNVRFAFKSGDTIYLLTFVCVTLVTALTGWVLGCLI